MEREDMYLDTNDLYQEDEFNEDEYSDGFMDGYEEALDAFADGDEESFKGLKGSRVGKALNIGQGGGKAGRQGRKAEKAAKRIEGGKKTTLFSKDTVNSAKDLIAGRQAAQEAPVENAGESPKDNTMLYVGIGVAVIVVIGVAVWYFKFRKK